MILSLCLAVLIPSQIVVNGRWVDTLRPDWKVEAGLEAPAPVEVSAPLGAASSIPSSPLAPPMPEGAALPRAEERANRSSFDSSGLVLISDSSWVASLSVRQAEVRDLLPALAMQHGVNLLLDPDVSGKVTLNLRKVRLRDVVRLLATDLSLDVVASGGMVRLRKSKEPAPSPEPPPVCQVQVHEGLIRLDAQGASLDQVARALGEKAGINLVVRSEGGASVRLLLTGLPPRRLVSALAEAMGLEMREQGGVYLLQRPAPAASTSDAGTAASGVLRVWMESDSSVSIEAYQAPLASAVQALAEKVGVDVVVLGALTGQVTLRLQRSAPERILDFLFAGSEFTWWKREGAWVVGLAGSPGVANSELLVLKHVKAEDAMELIPQSIQKNAQLKLVKSHNGIMVLGSRESIEGLRAYLEHIDRPVPQILIEALVVDIDMDKVRNIGMRAFLGKAGIGTNSRSIYPSVEQSFDAWDVDWAMKAAGLRDVVKLPDDFFLKVNALEQEKLLQVRSRPQISTLNGSEAKLAVGQTQYFLLNTETNFGSGAVAGSSTTTTQRFEKIEANVTLTVTPYVSGEGEITCEIAPDFSEPEGSFDAKTPPTINHRVLHSKVRLRDGETIILGGLVKESVNRIDDQVPLLGSIPFLGYLFKNRSSVKSRSQLMIFVTPHIYYGSDAQVDPDRVMESLSK